jgi:hypothetical protein
MGMDNDFPLCVQVRSLKVIYLYNIILQQHVSTTFVSIIRVPYSKNVVKIHLVVKKCIIKPFHIRLDFYNARYSNKIIITYILLVELYL